jgi:hypothetical protein
MVDKREGVGDYVRHVQESTQQYTRDVLKENERLGALVTALHDENTRLERAVSALEDRAKRQAEAQSSLMEQIAQMDATSRAFTARYLEVEQANSSLANLYVASYRIHGSLERDDVLSTLCEILINLIGTEEFAIFERDADLATMRCTVAFGIDRARVPSVRVGSGQLGEAIAIGAPFVSPADPAPTAAGCKVIASVPLWVGERVVGAIVVYGLLAHKSTLEPCDVELFNLLATHGATALYCSALHARHRGEARA